METKSQIKKLRFGKDNIKEGPEWGQESASTFKAVTPGQEKADQVPKTEETPTPEEIQTLIDMVSKRIMGLKESVIRYGTNWNNIKSYIDLFDEKGIDYLAQVCEHMNSRGKSLRNLFELREIDEEKDKDNYSHGFLEISKDKKSVSVSYNGNMRSREKDVEAQFDKVHGKGTFKKIRPHGEYHKDKINTYDDPSYQYILKVPRDKFDAHVGQPKKSGPDFDRLKKVKGEKNMNEEVIRNIKRKIGWGTLSNNRVEVKEENILESVTRKHFKQVADLIKSHDSQEKRNELAKHHAEIFSKQNPRFDHKRFHAAAGSTHLEKDVKEEKLDDMNESVEPINELSKNTLRSYKNKADTQANQAWNRAERAEGQKHGKAISTYQKRSKGSDLATLKLGNKVDNGSVVPKAKVAGQDSDKKEEYINEISLSAADKIRKIKKRMNNK